MKKSRKTNSKTSRQLLATVVVAAGLAIVWSTVVGWGTQVTKNAFSKKRVSERLQIADDGTPVVVTTSGDLEVSRRTLGGKPWPNEYEDWLSGAWFSRQIKKPGLVEYALPWEQRYSGGSDGKKPPTAWYFLRNAESHGQTYLMGIDASSKLPIGYIGRKGFRVTPLPVNEHFELPKAQDRSGLDSGALVSTQYFQTYQLVQSHQHRLSRGRRIPPWLVYITEADRLLEVDLRKRSVRTALELPGIHRAASLYAVVPKAPEPNADSKDTDKIKTETRFAILTDDRIVIYDPPTDEKREFMLPAEAKFIEKGFRAYLIGPQKLLLTHGAGRWEQGSVEQLLWLTADGKVERRERVELAGRVEPSERKKAWQTMPLLPLPIAWLGKTALYDPLTKMQQRQVDNYPAALRNSVHISWPPIVVVLLLALVAAGVAMRWHRKYRRPNAGLWWLMVFLFGPVGLLAYWLQQKIAVLESCKSCDQLVPRDREACAACGQEFPAPKLRGTEIFA